MPSERDEGLAYAISVIGRELGRVEPWQRDAACREHPGVEFFIERGESSEPARAVCGRCLVRAECLDYALRIGTKHGLCVCLS